MPTPIKLPPSLHKNQPAEISNMRQITIIGANGAGKSRFMDEMTELCGDRAYCLSVLSAFFPQREESTRKGSIDDMYRQAIRQQSFMRTDAVSEIDKLSYMLFADEMKELVLMKESAIKQGGKVKLRPTKLDSLRRIWEKVFPGNKILGEGSQLIFSTKAGDDLVSAFRLSQGEKAVLYYAAAVLFAMPEAVIFIDSPSLFVHPSIIGSLWNAIEELRPDCTFVYNSVDEDFVSSRTRNACIWVKQYNGRQHVWDYQILGKTPMTEELMVELAGSRKPVLFIEGDARHSIDARLYSLVFRDRTVKPLGSCDKVIETTRSFNDLTQLHHLQSMGIVDRDRRTDKEVEYLRNKKILVPDVAEVENIFLMPEIVRTMARLRGRDPERVERRVEKEVMRIFRQHAEEQVLQHVSHKVKRDVECKVDARFNCITALETHLKQLWTQLQPRKHYNILRERFAAMIRDSDYRSVLRVFNHKPMLPDSGVHLMLGFHSKEDYISGVLDVLKSSRKESDTIRNAIKHCLHADVEKSEARPEKV